MLRIYNYFAIKLLFCQTQIQCSSILSTRTQYGASVQLYCKALKAQCIYVYLFHVYSVNRENDIRPKLALHCSTEIMILELTD